MSCELPEDFLYNQVPQDGPSGTSGAELSQQQLESWLARFKLALEGCLEDVDARVEALEASGGGGGGGGGASDFLSLSDTPSSYSGQAGLYPKVNAGETALEFASVAGGADSDGLTLDYSTSEQSTGRTWVDGSTIYQKTINFGALPNATAKAVAHGISNLGRVLRCDAIAWNSAAGQHLVLPFATTTSVTVFQIQLNISSVNITVTTGNNRTAYDLYVTLWYLKSA